MDNAALEHQLGPVFHRVVAGGRGRDPTQNKQQYGSQGFHTGSKPRRHGAVEAGLWTLWAAKFRRLVPLC